MKQYLRALPLLTLTFGILAVTAHAQTAQTTTRTSAATVRKTIVLKYLLPSQLIRMVKGEMVSDDPLRP